MSLNHYCTYFDSGFLLQGLALWQSLRAHDNGAVLWVLTLDEVAFDTLRALRDPSLRIVSLSKVEGDEPLLAPAKKERTRAEYYFTLSPIWPLWILQNFTDVQRITYIDADLFWFSDPSILFELMDESKASLMVTEHRFPVWQRHLERHGRYNVGVLSFRNDDIGRACLKYWREQCLAWCFDRIEDGRYADQGYLNEWPERYGGKFYVAKHPGVNVAPWNWLSHRWSLQPIGGDVASGILVDGVPLICYHFARFQAICGWWYWRSGQIEYGVMPRTLRNAVYGPYVKALVDAERLLRELNVFRARASRVRRPSRKRTQGVLQRAIFGGNWIRIAGRFYNLRLGLGRWSGFILTNLRSIALRKKRRREQTSQKRH